MGRVITVDGSGPRRPNKYPLDQLEVGDQLLVTDARDHLRGSLYNRAETLGITIRCVERGRALLVQRQS